MRKQRSTRKVTIMHCDLGMRKQRSTRKITFMHWEFLHEKTKVNKESHHYALGFWHEKTKVKKEGHNYELVVVVLGFYLSPTAKVIRRLDLGLKSHPKDWRSPGIMNIGFLEWKKQK